MDTAHKETDKLLEKLEKNINTEYKQLSEEVQKQIEPIMNNISEYDENNTPTETDDKEAYKKALEAYIIGRMLLMPTKKQITAIATTIYEGNVRASEIINASSAAVYELNARATWDITFEKVPNLKRASFADAIKDFEKLFPVTLNREKDIVWNSKHVRDTLISGLNSGKSNQKIAKDFERINEMNKKSATMRARTATTGAENKARYDTTKYAEKKYGIKFKKKWVAIIDNRTRDSHVRINGETVDVDDKLSNGLMYPCDPNGEWAEIANCRCTTEYKVIE